MRTPHMRLTRLHSRRCHTAAIASMCGRGGIIMVALLAWLLPAALVQAVEVPAVRAPSVEVTHPQARTGSSTTQTATDASVTATATQQRIGTRIEVRAAERHATVTTDVSSSDRHRTTATRGDSANTDHGAVHVRHTSEAASTSVRVDADDVSLDASTPAADTSRGQPNASVSHLDAAVPWRWHSETVVAALAALGL